MAGSEKEMNLCAVNEITTLSPFNLLDTKRKTDAPNFKASTKQGIIKVLYGYVPSEDLLASVSSVAAIEKNSKAAQLPSLTSASHVMGISPSLTKVVPESALACFPAEENFFTAAMTISEE